MHSAERAAHRHPADVTKRLAWAEVLASKGLRAAAMHEVLAIRALGGDVSVAFSNSLRVGEWSIAEFIPTIEGVAPPLEDSRFPGARVKRDGAELPLALVLAPVCTHCDDEGTMTCLLCDGSGVKSEHEIYPCPERVPCNVCWGVKFLIRGVRKVKSACPHDRMVIEMTGTHFTLKRCRKCKLPAIRTDAGLRNFVACAKCTNLECTCR